MTFLSLPGSEASEDFLWYEFLLSVAPPLLSKGVWSSSTPDFFLLLRMKFFFFWWFLTPGSGFSSFLPLRESTLGDSLLSLPTFLFQGVFSPLSFLFLCSSHWTGNCFFFMKKSRMLPLPVAIWRGYFPFSFFEIPSPATADF